MRGKDSRVRSICEIAFDTVIAASVATTLNYLILPHYIETIESGEFLGMLSISFWYVSASMIRKYFIRRWFVNMKTTPSRKVIDSLYLLKRKFPVF